MTPATARADDDDDAAPVAQSLRIGFAVLRAAMLALAVFWATSNIRTVPPDRQAVLVRFGAVVGVRESGLVLAWPRPFEAVFLVPGPQRLLELPIDAGTAATAAVVDPVSRLFDDLPPARASLDLTGDGGAILLDTTLLYRVVDPAAYWLGSAHVAPALRRLALAAATGVVARSDLNDLVVVQGDVHPPGPAGPARALPPAVQARREAVRAAVVADVNRRLAALAATGAPLGVAAVRADIAASLPPAAKLAFDSVLEATQMAEQGLAIARTDAQRAAQGAAQEADRLRAAARAAADERISVARTHESRVTAVAGDARARPSLVDALYRERIAAILHAAGSVSTVDPATTRLLLPAGAP